VTGPGELPADRIAEQLPEAPGPGEEFVYLGIPDVHGSIRGKALRPHEFDLASRDGAVVTDLLLALDPTDEPITDYERFGIRAGAGDLRVHPDPDTLRDLTWLPGWRVCLATPTWLDGGPCAFSSREALRGILARMSELGYEVRAALEYEVRVSDGEGNPLSGPISYSFVEVARFHEFLARLRPALEGLGVEISAVHTEPGGGLLEMNLAARPGLRAADDAAFVKLGVKGVASAMGLRASFLAKTLPTEEGSSGHVHLSLWSDGANAFAPTDPAGELPPTLGSAVAGILDHLPAASLLLNPTINSYKRLVPGWFTPVNVSWGVENRSCALRAIRSASAERCRIECRRPGADANPYLAIAGLLAGAADGVAREAEPPEPISGDASERSELPPLPGSLEGALAAFEADEGFRRSLGEEFCDYYATSRRWELRAWRRGVSDWERERYERAV
jgi:glutamine synthetase